MDKLLNNIKQLSYIKLNKKLPSYKRFLFDRVKSTEDNILGIYGSRGVGKTTLMLQVAKELDLDYEEMIYISCDHPLLQDVSLFAFVEYFYSLGGKCILIDEIHESKNTLFRFICNSVNKSVFCQALHYAKATCTLTA